MVYPHTYRTEHSETHTTNAEYGESAARSSSKKIVIQPDLLKVLQYTDSHRQRFLDDLAEAVAIKSISGSLEYRDEVQKMIKFTENWLCTLGLKNERYNIGFFEVEGKRMRLPTIILATLGSDFTKRTVCVYIHLDVMKPDESKWIADPWKVTYMDHDKHYYGAGVASGKAALIHWFHVIQAFQSSNVEMPVNLKFIIESMYYHKSLGLSEFLPLRKHDFFNDLDSIVVCDSEWIGEKHPCLVYATVGILHYDLIVEKTEGSKTEPGNDLIEIFKEVVDSEERILIPHFADIVVQITPAEEKVYEAITDFNLDEARKNLPPYKQTWDQVKLLMSYWRLPSIWVGETEECTCTKKDPNIFKKHFIVKLVPRQIISNTMNLITTHIENVTKKLNIENKVTCKLLSSSRYWTENVRAHHYEAARRATIQIYKEDPNMIREDKDRYVLTILDEVLESNILLLPLVSHGANSGRDNENTSKLNFYESPKMLAAYLFQIALAKKTKVV